MELILLSGALLAAGGYIMYLHREIGLYKQDVMLMEIMLKSVEAMLKDAKERADEEA
mgnify:CR=1 FL=1|jgi:hypothetical protein